MSELATTESRSVGNEELAFQAAQSNWRLQAATVLEQANALAVRDEEGIKTGATLVRACVDAGKELERIKRSFTDPLMERVNGIRATFKEPTDTLASAELIVRTKVDLFRREEEKRRRDEEAAARKEREAAEQRRAEDAKALRDAGLDAKQVAAAMPTIPPVQVEAPMPKLVRAEGGAGFTSVKKWTFEVTDENAVPRQFLSVDQRKLDAAIKGGTREIAGVRIFQEEKSRLA
jgi:G3E family GTPase